MGRKESNKTNKTKTTGYVIKGLCCKMISYYTAADQCLNYSEVFLVTSQHIYVNDHWLGTTLSIKLPITTKVICEMF